MYGRCAKKSRPKRLGRQVDFGTSRFNGSQRAFLVPSSRQRASPLPLGSVRTEIASVELHALAFFLIHERRKHFELLRRDAVRQKRDDVLHPLFIGGEDLEGIAD